MDLAIYLEKNSKTPLYRQLIEQVRSAILQGKLKPNQKLASSRTLANYLNISRSTVTLSYEQLESEGYLETRLGSGTYVCDRIPDDWVKLVPTEPQNQDAFTRPRLSKFGTNLLSINHLEVSEPNYEISFRYGNPASEYFPIKQWQKLLNRYCENSPKLLNYASDALGYFGLRKEISDYLARSRGVNCHPEQVIIINGSQQGLDLIARLTLDAEDWVALENPSYLGVRHCFMGQLANIQPIPITEEGLDIDVLSRCQQNFKLVYVTPSHQFPTGVTLSLSKRIALLQWAQKTNTLIIEDDYDSEYRYGQQPIPALQGMDKTQSVIYIGTFSKTIFPSLRIGYLVVPDDWIPIISKAKWLCDRFCPILEQYALADWIAQGHFERYIRKMRQLYNLRRQALISAFKQYFGDRAIIFGANAGIHVMVKIQTNLADDVVICKASQVGIGLISARKYYLTPKYQGEFIFGYGQLNEEQIDRGIRILAKILCI